MSSAIGEALGVDPLTVTVSALSCGVFFLLIVLLLLNYRRVPLCCKTGSSRHTNAPPHYHSRDALIGCALHDDIINRDVIVHNQSPEGGPFVIGKPSDYHLPGAMPRLPSYESLRRNDRRTHIHHMITERFGLSSTSSHRDWQQPPPPPSYEESLRQPLNVPSLGLRRLDDEAFPAQDGRSSHVDRSAASDQPGPQRLTSQDRSV